ncbi:MAG TPA: SpoIID/LytB domain-containing protein [Gemmatimonadaceae bacterium]
MKRTALCLTVALIACSTRVTRRTGPRPPQETPDRTIRVALAVPSPFVGATGELRWYEGDGRTFIVRGRSGEQWRVERESRGARVRVIRPDGVPTAWQRALVARVNDDGFVTVNSKRYRGELTLLPLDSDLVVINRLGVEEYLRGVVPLEMGSRRRGDSAALQAQAVASRSYAYVRLGGGGDAQRIYDVRSSTADQVYGGADVETDVASDAVEATHGLVLRYAGRTVDAPFHSTCGGTTAEPNEVWRTPGATYLKRVSDRIGGAADRFYCDIAPRYRWTRTLTGSQLNAALEQYLKQYAAVPGGRPGTARVIGVRDRTASGRVGVLDIETDRGIFPLRGDDMRYVLRVPGGEILNSTYFSVEPEYRNGFVSRVTLRGQGNGHGVGMCQWGAIGRARAGQSFRSILGTYYPGTTVGPVSAQ